MKMTLRPYSQPVGPDKYVYGEAVPVNIFIDGQKVEAPKAGIKVGRAMFPDTMGRAMSFKLGDFIDDKEAGA